MDQAIVNKRLVARDSVVPASEPSVAQCTRAFLALQGETDAGSESALNTFLRELGMLELEFDKASMVAKLAEEEINQYKHLDNEIQKRIGEAEKDITQLQTELVNEKLMRQRKEECETLASQVNTEVPRAVSQAAVAEVQAELETLRNREQDVLNQLDLRRKQFQLLMHAVAELSQSLQT